MIVRLALFTKDIDNVRAMMRTAKMSGSLPIPNPQDHRANVLLHVTSYMAGESRNDTTHYAKQT